VVKIQTNKTFCKYRKKALKSEQELVNQVHEECILEVTNYQKNDNEFSNFLKFRDLMIKNKNYDLKTPNWKEMTLDEFLKIDSINIYKLDHYPDYFLKALKHIKDLTFYNCQFDPTKASINFTGIKTLTNLNRLSIKLVISLHLKLTSYIICKIKLT